MHRPWVTIATHAVLLVLAYLTAFVLRFDSDFTSFRAWQFATTLPVLLPVRLLVFWRFGIFRLNWRHIGFRDILALESAVTLSALLFVVTLYFVGLLHGMPRSVFIIDWVLSMFFCGGVMFATRYLRERRPRYQPVAGKRTLLIGAGAGAERLLRQAQHEREHDLAIVGIVDDDPATHDETLHGVPVLGSTRDMSRLCAQFRVELIVQANRTVTRLDPGPSCTIHQIRSHIVTGFTHHNQPPDRIAPE